MNMRLLPTFVACLVFVFAPAANAQNSDVTEATEWLAKASKHLPGDSILVGVADVEVAAGFEVAAPLFSDSMPADERAAKIAELRRIYSRHFETVMGFKHQSVRAVVYGVGPAGAAAVVFGPTKIKNDAGRETREIAGKTAVKLSPQGESLWAIPDEELGALILVKDQQSSLDVWKNGRSLATSPGRLEVFDALLDKAGAGQGLVSVVDVDESSTIAKSLQQAEPPLARRSILKVSVDGTITTAISGGLPWARFGDAMGSSTRQFVRAALEAAQSDQSWPVMAMLGVVAKYALSVDQEQASRDPQSWQTGLTMPIGLTALFSASGAFALQPRISDLASPE